MVQVMQRRPAGLGVSELQRTQVPWRVACPAVRVFQLPPVNRHHDARSRQADTDDLSARPAAERDTIAVPLDVESFEDVDALLALGFPVDPSERIGDGDDRVQCFERGLRNVRDGVVQHWIASSGDLRLERDGTPSGT
ncbi:hypothetical protein ABT369_16930 [Dactylosporangium sp. NPDC000244]|uniref:hypothetical protein n=1 Tax=Dactylosporangium sp. NPDC000244 TaxID=3154365 RepID=UPI00332A7B55